MWYFPLLNQMPPVKESITLSGPIYLNSRGIYLTWPRLTPDGIFFAFSIVIGLILAVVAWKLLLQYQMKSGKTTLIAEPAICCAKNCSG